MQRLSINFIADQRSLVRSNPVLGYSILLVGLLALAITGWDFQQQTTDNSNLEDRRNTLQKRAKHLRSPVPIPVEMIAQVEQANAAYALFQTPWEDILASLEAARNKSPDGIALLSVKVDKSKQELTLSGEAVDFTALSTFTSALSDTPIFKNISLTNDKLSTGIPPVVVTFDLRLSWRNTAVAE